MWVLPGGCVGWVTFPCFGGKFSAISAICVLLHRSAAIVTLHYDFHKEPADGYSSFCQDNCRRLKLPTWVAIYQLNDPRSHLTFETREL